MSDPTNLELWQQAREAWKNAYDMISNTLKKGNNNVTCVLHVGQEVLQSNNTDHQKIIDKLKLKHGIKADKQGDQYYTTVELMMNKNVDMIGFSVFSDAFSNSQNSECEFQCNNNIDKSCSNCTQIHSPCVNTINDASLKANMDVAKTYYNHIPLMICESGMLSPWQCKAYNSIQFLKGIMYVLKHYNIKYWSFIGGNSWKKTGWDPKSGWPQWPFWHFSEVKNFFIQNVIPHLDQRKKSY